EAAMATGVIFLPAAVEALLPYLDEPRLRRLIEQVRAMTNLVWRDEVLAAFAPRLAQLGAIGDALALARSLQNRSAAASALATLAPMLSDSDRAAAARTVLDAIRDVDDAAWRRQLGDALTGLTEAQRSFFAVVLNREFWRADVLAAIAPHLSPA